MEGLSSTIIDTTRPTFDLSLHKSTANRLDYLYEISHVPEDSKIPIIDFPIVNLYNVFDKPQPWFKKTIKKFIGPSHLSTVKEYVQTSKFDQFNIPARENENFITLALNAGTIFVLPFPNFNMSLKDIFVMLSRCKSKLQEPFKYKTHLLLHLITSLLTNFKIMPLTWQFQTWPNLMMLC